MPRRGHLAAAALFVGGTSARAATIATFADPAADGSTPLFNVNATTGTVTGGWTGIGLNLLTPGVPAPDFPDAMFSMTPLTILGSLPLTALSGGTIQFFDKLSNPLLTISFTNAFLSSALSLGSSDFVGFNVTMSGPILPGPVTDEAFSFSFANPMATANGFTVTSSFTSSATPEPGSIILAAIGLALAARKLRR